MKGCWMSSRPLGGGDCESGSGTAFQAHLRVHGTWQGLSTLREAGDQKLGKATERRSIASSWLALAPWTHANESHGSKVKALWTTSYPPSSCIVSRVGRQVWVTRSRL